MKVDERLRGKRGIVSDDVQIFSAPDDVEHDSLLRPIDEYNQCASSDERSWVCPHCTFLNAEWAPACKMCDARCEVYVCPVAGNVQDQDDDSNWPTLKEAADPSWAHCEVSSVGSS